MLKCLLCFILFLVSNALYAESSKAQHHPIKVDTVPNLNNSNILTYNLESDNYNSTDYLSSALEFSSKRGYDIQFAIYNIPINGGGAQNYEYSAFINLSKTFDLLNNFNLIVGSQHGTTLLTQHHNYHNADYAVLLYNFGSSNIHFGSYWVNSVLSTTTDTLGYTGGFDIKLYKNIHFVGDYYSGHNNLSGGNVNLLYKTSNKLEFYCGVSVPETNSGNEFYGISGINFIF